MTDQPERVDSLVRDLPDAEAPPGFADRIVVLHAQKRRTRRTMTWSAVGAALSLACAIAVVDTSARDFSGELAATERASVVLGQEAAAVAEPGAVLAFAVDGRLGADTIEVTQSAGRAFYRVEPGTQMTVKTPAGEVRVHGTCFHVDVQQPPQETDMPRPSLKPLAHATLGAVLGATLAVVVVEGEVSVHNTRGEARASPGETIIASAHAAPVAQETRAVSQTMPRDSLVVSRAELEALRDAASKTPDVTALVKRNAELEEKVRKADEELALTDEVRKAEEGTAMKFPDDLHPRFQGPELQKAFEAAMNEAGIEGGVIDVDCSEYPCIIYGQLTDREDMEKLREAQSLRPYQSDSNSTSVWTVKKDGTPTAYFGVQLAPEGQDMDEMAMRRQERRVRDGWDKIKPPKE